MTRKKSTQFTKQRPSRPAKKSGPLKPWLPPDTYYAHTMSGLEQIAWREIEQVWPQATLIGFENLEKKMACSFFDSTERGATQTSAPPC